jgi:uncharacterized membrane protein
MNKTSNSEIAENFTFRIIYGAFVLLSIYFFFTGDLSNATINLGIALVFDPFDQKVTWAKRPVYQRAWLIVHLIALFTAAGFLLTGFVL